MLISLNWIKDFVSLPDIDSHDLANDFTMKTAEVEGVEETNSHLTKIFVAQIKEINKHPEADKLNLVTFDFGGKETREVVCGAPNVAVGKKVPYAPIGTTLPGGFTLEPKKIRGILSEGMLCSETELGLGEGAKGLMELPSDAPNGMTMSEFLKINSDIVIDVDNKSLTHRPDLWGMHGLAREFSAIYGNPMKDIFNADWFKKLESKFSSEKSPIIPTVQESSNLLYLGLSVNGVSVGESPTWIKERLNAVGLRPINNIVDISNYVMIELGIPLHIFDRKKIKGELVIKRVGEECEFTTLDEMNRKLIASDTVICDDEKPLVLAGVMGGLNSGVDDNTTDIFIEVANWKAEEVRTTSTRLGLRTDSSARYEKNLDSSLCYRTILRTLELVLELCPEAKVVGKVESAGPEVKTREPLKLKTSVDKINSVLGTNLESEKIISIFSSLDFKVSGDSDLELIIPNYRTTKDISCEADLIEEIGRIIGYDNIVDKAPLQAVKPVRLSPEKTLQNKIKTFMSTRGNSLEVMTYPLVGETVLSKAAWPVLNTELTLVNALTKDADRMRPSIIPSILQACSLNTKQYSQFKLFEVGRAYNFDKKNFSKESNQVVLAFYSRNETPFVETLNAMERLLNFLNLPFEFETQKNPKFDNPIIPFEWKGNHPHEFVSLKVMGRYMGAATTVHPLILRNFKMKGFLSIAVLDLSAFESRPIKDNIKYKAINKFPTSTFDCSVLVELDKASADTLLPFKKVKVKELVDAKIVDVFKLNDTHKSVTLRAFFEDSEKTLESSLLKAAEDEIIKALAEAGYPLKEA